MAKITNKMLLEAIEDINKRIEHLNHSLDNIESRTQKKDDNVNPKLNVLTETFDLIKFDIEDDPDSIARVLKQIQTIKPQKAIELWHELIEININYLSVDKSEYGPATHLTSWMYTELSESYDFISSEKYFLEDKWLLNIVFGQAPYFYCSVMKTIDSLIKQNRFLEADALFEIILSNEFALKQTTLYELLDYEFDGKLPKEQTYYDRVVWDDEKKYSEEAIEMFKKWISNVESQKERMKLLTCILQFIED